MKINIIVVLSILLLQSHISSADPSQNIKYLMNEPVSLFDLGILRLNEQVKGLKLTNGGKLESTVDYEWDRNRIRILVFGPSDMHPKSLMEAKNWCHESFRSIRLTFGVNPDKGIPSYLDKSLLSVYFSHQEYLKGNKPKNIEAELDNITEIVAVFTIEDKDKTTIKCQGPLVSNEILFSD